MRKIIVVGKCFSSQNNGPANIIRGLVSGFCELEVNIYPILLTEKVGKREFLKGVLSIPIKEENCAVNVHTDGYLIPLLMYFISLIDRKNHYYLTIHGIYLIETKMSGTQKRIYCALEKFLYKYFKNVICVSEMLKDDIKRIYKRKRNTHVIPNATNATEYKVSKSQFSKGTLKIISLGGLQNRKGIWETLDLMAYLIHIQNFSVELEIYGNKVSNETYHFFLEKVLRLDIEKAVSFEGEVSQKETIYDILTQADAQVSLSKYDTFNVAIVESLALGCPCICSDRCGAAYLINQNSNGLVVDLQSQNYNEEIYKYLKKIVDFEIKYEDVMEDALKIKKLVSWEGVCQSYLDYMI